MSTTKMNGRTFLKKYRIMVLLDNPKDADLASAKEGGYGEVIVNEYTKEIYDKHKVRMTIPIFRTYLGAVIRSLQYSRMGIFNCIVKT